MRRRNMSKDAYSNNMTGCNISNHNCFCKENIFNSKKHTLQRDKEEKTHRSNSNSDLHQPREAAYPHEIGNIATRRKYSHKIPP